MNAPALTFNPVLGTGDIRLAPGGPPSAPWLVTAVFILLFTNARRGDDEAPASTSDDRGGYWGDAFFEQSTGSRLWRLERAQATRQTLDAAVVYVQEALQPLLTENKLEAISVQGAVDGNQLTLELTYTLPGGEQGQLDLKEIWDYALAT